MPCSEKTKLGRALPAFIILVLVWGSMPLFLKHFTDFLDAWTVNGVRYTVAVLFWLPFVLRYYRTSIRGTGILRAAIPPALFHAGGQVTWALSPYYNDASVMHFIARTSFLFVMLFGFILLVEERVLMRKPLFWAGAAGTVAGVIFMYVGGVETGSTTPLGLVLLLTTAAFWALYGIAVRRCLQAYSARLSFGVISLYTVPMLWLLMFAVGDWRALAEVGAVDWGFLIFTGLGGIALGHVMLYTVIRHLGPIITDGTFQLIPFLTALGAWFFLGEHMSSLQWMGGVLLVAAAYAFLVTRHEYPPPVGG